MKELHCVKSLILASILSHLTVNSSQIAYIFSYSFFFSNPGSVFQSSITETGSTVGEKDTLPVSIGLQLIFVDFLYGVPLSEFDVDNSLSLFAVVLNNY